MTRWQKLVNIMHHHDAEYGPSMAPKSPILPYIPSIWLDSLACRIAFNTDPWLFSESITDLSSATFCLAACSSGIRVSCSLKHSYKAHRFSHHIPSQKRIIRKENRCSNNYHENTNLFCITSFHCFKLVFL